MLWWYLGNTSHKKNHAWKVFLVWGFPLKHSPDSPTSSTSSPSTKPPSSPSSTSPAPPRSAQNLPNNQKRDGKERHNGPHGPRQDLLKTNCTVCQMWSLIDLLLLLFVNVHGILLVKINNRTRDIITSNKQQSIHQICWVIETLFGYITGWDPVLVF